MTSSILGALTRQQNGAAAQTAPKTDVKRLVDLVKTARNPQAMLAQMMGNNPAMAQAQALIRESGGDPQKAFFALAKKQGIDPNEILKLLQ